MKHTAHHRLLMILTVFSLFFGAGNLIFPPFLAAQAGQNTWPAMAGFCLTAVGFPVLGVMAVTRAGDLHRLAARVHPAFAAVFPLLIYLAIGPGLAIPRTASTSFEMVAQAALEGSTRLPLWQLAYSLVFFAVAGLIALKPDALTQRLGKVLCPLLLALIGALFVGCLLAPHPYGAVAEAYQTHPVIQGFLDGYQTMDAIAALVFGSVIALNLRALGLTEARAIRTEAALDGVGAGVLLGVVYLCLAHIGGVSGGAWPGAKNGAQVLSQLAGSVYGRGGMALLAAIFVVACLNTCVGLLSSCASYFHQRLPKVSYPAWVALFALISVGISNVGLNQILALSVPVLNLLYPIVLVLILLAYLPKTETLPLLYPIAGWGTLAASAALLAAKAGVLPAALTDGLRVLPLYAQGLGWLCPCLVFLALGAGLSLLKQRA